jgi:hypothetical protein
MPTPPVIPTSAWIGLLVFTAACFLGPMATVFAPMAPAGWRIHLLLRVLAVSIPAAVLGWGLGPAILRQPNRLADAAIGALVGVAVALVLQVAPVLDLLRGPLDARVTILRVEDRRAWGGGTPPLRELRAIQVGTAEAQFWLRPRGPQKVALWQAAARCGLFAEIDLIWLRSTRRAERFDCVVPAPAPEP